MLLEWLVGRGFELWPYGSYMVKDAAIEGAVGSGKTAVLDLFVENGWDVAGLDREGQAGEE